MFCWFSGGHGRQWLLLKCVEYIVNNIYKTENHNWVGNYLPKALKIKTVLLIAFLFAEGSGKKSSL